MLTYKNLLELRSCINSTHITRRELTEMVDILIHDYTTVTLNNMIDSLTKKELIAFNVFFGSFTKHKGILIVSKLSDKENIGRTQVVNMLRKLEVSGFIVTKQLGVKGTYIEITNRDAISKMKQLLINKSSNIAA